MHASESTPTQSASLPGLSIELTLIGVIPRSLERALLLANLVLSAAVVALAADHLLAAVLCGIHILLQVISAMPLRRRDLQRHHLRELMRLVADGVLLLLMPLAIGGAAPTWILALPVVLGAAHSIGFGRRTILTTAGLALAASTGIALEGGAPATASGAPSQQIWPLTHNTRSEAAITTCRSWLTITTAQPRSARTASIRR